MTPIPAVLMRGGTSKGIFLHARDIPPPGPQRDALLLAILGSPDPMQIDGLGGTYSSTSKVMVVEPRSPDTVSYRFAQVGVADRIVDWSGNCGNLTTAVGPFAIDEGLVAVDEPLTRLRLVNENTGVVVETEVPVRDGRAQTTGDLAVAGVPGTGAPILTRYLDPGGRVLGAILPTESPIDQIITGDGSVAVSIVDVTHPYVFVDAGAVDLRDDARPPADLNADPGLLERVERIRAACAVRVGRAHDTAAARTQAPTVPRIVLVRPDPRADFGTVSFSMGQAHRALPMTAALCVAAATHLPGTVPANIASAAGTEVRIAHPRGVATVYVEAGAGCVRSVAVVRTARRLMDGRVYPREY